MRNEHIGATTKTSSERYEPTNAVVSVFNALVIAAVIGLFGNAIVESAAANTEVAQQDAKASADPT